MTGELEMQIRLPEVPMMKNDSKVRALRTKKEDRSGEEVLREALSTVSKYAADGEKLDAIVFLIHPDGNVWPMPDWSCRRIDVVEAAAVIGAISSQIILEDLAEEN